MTLRCRQGDVLFLEAAAEIAGQLVAHQRHTRDGSLYWSGPGIRDGEVAAVPLVPYLYPGTTGVALFLAAMERVVGNGGYRDLCLRALAPLRRELSSLVADPARADIAVHFLGGLSGLGSLVYGLLKAGILLGERALVGDARDLSALITLRRIAEDERLDVMFGAAGALLALLALEREAPGPNARGSTPLELATACAARLLEQRTYRREGFRVWPLGTAQRPLGGFAHGAAGIACALLRLFGRTGDPALLAAAREGIAHERTLYEREGREWRLSWRPGTRFARSWCNGAAGIALGRLELPGLAPDDESLNEVREALAATGSPELDDDDLLCCGNLGRADVLLHAAGRLGDESLAAAARTLAGRVLERARARGSYGLTAASRHTFDPRLFLGLSGIGYTLLRLADPGLPCVVALA